jgi:hypothetical protein
METTKYKADNIGIMSSTICLLHCIATPFIFITGSCAVSCCNNSPIWWRLIDFIFIIISFVAVYYAAKRNYKTWLKLSFYIAFTLLLLIVLNKHFLIIKTVDEIIYFPAALLIGLHIYNRKNCQC